MKLEIKKTGNKPVEWAKFSLSDVPVSFVNALRRIIVSEVPILSIEDVEILQNNSVLYDEMLALRLGLIPIKANPSLYENKRSFKTGFVLKVEGPKWIYSKDLSSMDPEIQPAFPDIPIAYLDEGQKIELEAWATVGTAQTHAKWQAGIAGYEQKSENNFEFYVESLGNMPVNELVKQAASILKVKGEEFGKWIKAKKS
ncbi:MAG: DNA-directed RNA polymerase subunit D [Candidatus Altiarchaeota archaeon]|nr:DNA-directed RNA polymerase subunit D [Candidatus Altiarchaeota archaeon]